MDHGRSFRIAIYFIDPRIHGDMVVTPAKSLSLLTAQGGSGYIIPQITYIKKGNSILALAAGGGNGSNNGGLGGNAGTIN